MAKRSITADLAQPSVDPVSDILKWILLVVAIVCFALLGWATVLTYEKAPPHPQAFTDRAGNVIMSADDIVAGKGGFQKADLMDYGSIYGMGSYFGEDYTASTLVRLGRAHQAKPRQFRRDAAGHQGARQQVARRSPGPPERRPSRRRPAAASPADALADAAATATMQKQLQGIDLTQPTVVVAGRRRAGGPRRCRASSRPSSTRSICRPAGCRRRASTRRCASRPPTSSSIRRSPRSRAGRTIRTRHGPRTGRTSRRSATRRRPTPSSGPGSASASPSSRWGSCCGSTAPISTIPTTRRWSAASPTYRALTPSQVKTGKYFIVVALVFLASQGAGAIMAHSYYERENFYGIQLNYILPFNFLQELPPAGADHLDRARAGSRAACSSPRRSPAAARRRGRGCWSTCCSGCRCSSSPPRCSAIISASRA